MIPVWKVRLAAAYVAVLLIAGLTFCWYVNHGAMEQAFDRGVIYGASLPCGAQ